MKTPIYTGIFQSDLEAAGYRITGLPLPTAGSDAATKSYVDINAGGGGTVVASSGESHQVTATELLNSTAGTRTPIASLATSLGNYFDSQSFDPCIIVNPTNPNQLIMLFSGMAAPVESGVISIGRATASVADPTVWTVSAAPVLSPTGGEGVNIRADSILYNPADSKIYLFYSTAGTPPSICLATSTDLGLTWTRLGVIVAPTGTETFMSQFSVLMEGTTLHAIYSYRTASAVLPAYRYASASTSNFLSWTKGGVDVFSDTGRYHEFHHFSKIFDTYVLLYESGSPSVDWDLRFATSSNPASGWVISPVTPFFTKSGVAGTFDRYHVATGQAMVINGQYYLIYCGAIDHASPYGTNHWQMGITPLLTPVSGSQLLIGPDLRLVGITGGGKLQARNPSTNTWADVDQWTNP